MIDVIGRQVTKGDKVKINAHFYEDAQRGEVGTVKRGETGALGFVSVVMDRTRLLILAYPTELVKASVGEAG